MHQKTIYDLIKTEEESFQLDIQIANNWLWNFRTHIEKSVSYKNSQYTKGSADRPFKNITRPILNLQYRAEGFDVKDIHLYVDDVKNYHKSLLVRKFHDRWARENNVDEFIDKLVESYVDYGGVLIKNLNVPAHEVVAWQTIAFCDQTGFLNGPFAIKHQFSPEQLRKVGKEGKWENIEQVIALAEPTRDQPQSNIQENQTPGKYIEVYEVHGCFPAYWLYPKEEYGDREYGDGEYGKDDYFNQLHVCTFYKDEKGEKHGIWLFKGKEEEFPFKLLLRDEIYGRALGLGGAEEIFSPQKWINYDVIRIRDLLDAACKIIFKINDPTFANRNKISNMNNLEIVALEDGKDITQIDTAPRNLNLFERAMVDWEQNARNISAAGEGIQGEQPPSGTPFKLQELVTAEAHSLHEYRKGKIAKFVEEIYRDWILPHLVKEIKDGSEFIAELDVEDLQFVADKLADNLAQKAIKDSLLNGILLTPELVEEIKLKVKESFLKGGNKRFVEILENEFKNVPMDVKINIVGKQKNLVAEVDKMVNVMRFLFSTYNPQTRTFAIFDDPRMISRLMKSWRSPGYLRFS